MKLPSLNEFKKDYLKLCDILSEFWKDNYCNWHFNSDKEFVCNLESNCGCCKPCGIEREKYGLKTLLGSNGCSTKNLFCIMYYCAYKDEDSYHKIENNWILLNPENVKDITKFFEKYALNESIIGTTNSSLSYVIKYFLSFEEICKRYKTWKLIYDTLQGSIPYNRIGDQLNSIFLWDKTIINNKILNKLKQDSITTFKVKQKVFIKDMNKYGIIKQVPSKLFDEYVILVDDKMFVCRKEQAIQS